MNAGWLTIRRAASREIERHIALKFKAEKFAAAVRMW